MSAASFSAASFSAASFSAASFSAVSSKDTGVVASHKGARTVSGCGCGEPWMQSWVADEPTTPEACGRLPEPATAPPGEACGDMAV
jgi:hypothetical protein